jgi:hypothetical protein
MEDWQGKPSSLGPQARMFSRSGTFIGGAIIARMHQLQQMGLSIVRPVMGISAVEDEGGWGGKNEKKRGAGPSIAVVPASAIVCTYLLVCL